MSAPLAARPPTSCIFPRALLPKAHHRTTAMPHAPAHQQPVKGPCIAISKNGPYIVTGGLALRTETIESSRVGVAVKWVQGPSIPTGQTYALCRCGRSSKMPFCDGNHVKAGFDGAECAGRLPFTGQAMVTRGPGLDLADVEKLCAGARFCDRAGGTWTLTEKSDDPASRALAIQESGDCPSGRLVALDKETGAAIEPTFAPSISLVEDPASDVSGPLWVKGGVPIESADGHLYETRNRITLCRCGASKNKPFCDGGHIDAKFDDGDDSLKED